MTPTDSMTANPGSAYQEIATSQRARAVELMGPAVERLRWSRAQLDAYRTEQLRALLAHASAHSAWHRRRLAGADLEAVTPDNLGSIPPMTKADLMEHWDDIVTNDALSLAECRSHVQRLKEGPAYLHDRYHVFTTGGSTGEPAVFVYDWDEWPSVLVSSLRWGMAFGGSDAAPQSVAFLGARHAHHMTAAGPMTFSDASVQPMFTVPLDQPTAAVIDALNELQPEGLQLFPSYLPILIEAAESGRLGLHLKSISTGGDRLLPEVAAHAERVLGARPVESYPCVDVGLIACGLPGVDGMFINEDMLIVEPVDEDDQPVPPGTLSHHVLITSFAYPLLPRIRYRLEDRIMVVEPHGEGPLGTFARVAQVDGRSDDLFRYNTVVVHPHVFRSAIARVPSVREYQVRQTARGADVLVAGGSDDDRRLLAERLIAALTALDLPEVEVTVTAVEGFERTAIGKHKLFVPQPPQSTSIDTQ